MKSHLATKASCIRCGAAVEDAEHVLRRCPGSVWVRGQLGRLLPWISASAPFRHWLFGHLQNRDNTLFCAMAWNLWKWRNSFVFEQVPWQPGDVMRRIHLDTVEFHRLAQGTQRSNPIASDGINSVMLYTDGSWNPQVNRMGSGGVLLDEIGCWICGFAASLGGGDALKSELLAMKKGLTHVWEMGIKSVTCYTDCLEAQQIITNNQDVDTYWHKDEIIAIRALLNKEWRVFVNYVPRERNQVADALAKLAVNENWDWKLWSQPQPTVISLLCQDVLS
ncbi:uncharacterized protein LOC130736924 [Lotus japonicus]|uniref:uncharacterized protein LOC130736924 n=1 Tax=Lotus japonicus TaxID=34305 RepID=UPI00258C1937|nr:uncharacterized protein LOC130736924 [Lotus japonicus]